MKRLLLTLLLVLLASCRLQEKKPEDPQLSPRMQHFVRLFAESRIATQACAGHPAEAREVRRQLLKKEGMTLAEVRSCTQELQTHPELWHPFWKSVREYTQTLGELHGWNH